MTFEQAEGRSYSPQENSRSLREQEQVEGNNEVMFRASGNGGVTLGDMVKLSNSTDADPIDP